MGTKSKGGKWIIKEFRIRWFCRNCLQHGIAGISIQPKSGFNGFVSATDVVEMISTTCHTDCKQPDIRFTEVKRKEKR